MPDTWVDELIPPHSPSARFVAELRAEVEDSWAGVQTVRTMSGRRRRVWPRTLAAVLGGAAATVALLAVVVHRSDDTSDSANHISLTAHQRLLAYLEGDTWTLLSPPGDSGSPRRSLTFEAGATSLTVDDGCFVAAYPVTIDEHAKVLDGPAVVVQVRLPSPVPLCNGVPVNDVLSLEGYRLAGSRGVLHLQLSPLTTGAARGIGAYVLQVPDLGGADR